MNNHLSFYLILPMAFAAAMTYGSETGKAGLSGQEISGQRLLNPSSEIITHKRVWEDAQANDFLCAGSVTQTLPVIGQCPDVPGYVEIGFPTCTQLFEIPKNFTVKEIAPGFVRLVCELDYANATPIGSPDCDYSRCQYIEEPEFPF